MFRVGFALVSVAASVFGAQPAGAVESLTATAEITERQFCIGMSAAGIAFSEGEELAPDAITIRLGLRISYRNSGAGPIILPNEHNWHLVLSRSLDDIAHHRRQVVIPNYGFGLQLVWRREDWSFFDCCERPELADFKVLPPGGVWIDDARPGSFQVHKSSAAGTGAELLGKHIFFQLELDHAMFPKQLISNLQTKWRPYGTLWAGKVRTQPIELDIPRSPDAHECKPLRGL